jgi:glycine/D-amino acid oxidase-like deaminating enzyme
MIEEGFSKEVRTPKSVSISGDLVIVGGGMSGVCAAITAAREGVKVILVQDRPVLGGNASSEVRMWILGATSHLGNNNRWSREGGVIDEILVENLYRNREGNTIIFDTLLLEKVIEEENITLLLNTMWRRARRIELSRYARFAVRIRRCTRYRLRCSAMPRAMA